SNNLSAPIPDFFANFKNLTVMNLASCTLNGKFPKKVLQLQSLQNLDLALNKKLSGSLPDFSGSLPDSHFNCARVLSLLTSRVTVYPFSNSSVPLLEWLDFSSNTLGAMTIHNCISFYSH
ncbi:receptor-like protein 12, partial [Tanacetum coccineum]